MKTSFRDLFLGESFRNLFTVEQKQKFAQEAFAQLQASYAKIGGIHGNGFKNVEDFVKNIPFWKLQVKNGKILAGAYYKDKNGRKRVAVSTDGSKEGKEQLARIMIDDLSQGRSYGESSGGSLAFLVKNVGEESVAKFAIDPSNLEKMLGDKIFPPNESDPEMQRFPLLRKFFFSREIGGKLHTKIALGTTGNRIS